MPNCIKNESKQWISYKQLAFTLLQYYYSNIKGYRRAFRDNSWNSTACGIRSGLQLSSKMKKEIIRVTVNVTLVILSNMNLKRLTHAWVTNPTVWDHVTNKSEENNLTVVFSVAAADGSANSVLTFPEKRHVWGCSSAVSPPASLAALLPLCRSLLLSLSLLSLITWCLLFGPRRQ